MDSLIFKWKLVEAESRILKQASFRAKGATIFRTSLVFKDVGMFLSGEMFADATGEVSLCFTSITGTTVCT